MSDQFDMIDSTHSLIRFESGVTGSLACYYVVPGTKVLNLYGVGGRAIAHEDSIEVLKEGASEPEGYRWIWRRQPTWSCADAECVCRCGVERF